MNDRTCIVTRKSGSKAEMIRFVAAPDHSIVPDIKANLPGRGAWLMASKTLLENAITKKAFSRSFKQDVTPAPTLVQLTEDLLIKDVMGSLSMARKAGVLISGAQKVDSAIRNGEAILVIHAKEAAEDGKRKISQAIHAAKQQGLKDVPVLSSFGSEELSLAFGENRVIHAAVLKGVASRGLMERVKKLQCFRDETQAD